MATNVILRDLDLASSGPVDGQQCEVVVDGLPLVRAAQIVVDTFLVFALRGDVRKLTSRAAVGRRSTGSGSAQGRAHLQSK